MTLNLAVGALHGLLCLGVLFLFVYGPWQKLCVDYARDVMFEQRDIIFDLAAQGRLSFNDEAYAQARSTINGMIRMAHCITAPRLITLMAYAAHADDPAPASQARHAIQQIGDDATRSAVMEAFSKAETAALALMVARSPVLIAVAVVAKFMGQFLRLQKRLLQAVTETLERAAAYEARQTT